MSGILGQVLGSIFSNANGRAGGAGEPEGRGGLGGGLGDAGLGGMLGGMLGGWRGGGMGGMGSRGALLAMLLPVALQWMQRNGGLNGVLEKFGQRGYQEQTKSWVSSGDNAPIDPTAVDQVMGHDDIAAIARDLGLQPGEVSGGMAELLPEVANQMTPDGHLPDEDSSMLDRVLNELSQMTRRG